MKFIPIETAKAGQVIAKDVYDNNMRLLITEGKELTEKQYLQLNYLV